MAPVMKLAPAKAPSVHVKALKHASRLGFGIIVLFGGTIGLWAATSTLSGAVVSGGQFVVDTNVKKVQHPTGGIVGELRVQEGDLVKAGDLLIKLDETVTKANLQIVSKQLDELWARQARLEAERDGAENLIVPEEFGVRVSEPAVKKLLASEQTLFDARRSAREGQKSQLRKRIAQLGNEIDGLKAQAASKVREASLISDELKGVRELYAKNLVQLSRLSALEREAASLEGQRGQIVAGMAQSEGKISETNLQIIQVDEEMRAEVMKDLRENQAKVVRTRRAQGRRRGPIEAHRHPLAERRLRAPARRPHGRRRDLPGRAGDADRALARYPRPRGEGDAAGHRPARHRPARERARPRRERPHHAGTRRHPQPHLRRRHEGPADRGQLLHDPRRHPA